MTTGLTPRQADLLAFIKTYLAEHNGVAPSIRNMQVALGLKSASGIIRLLRGLEERKFIRRPPHLARAIEVIDQGCTCPHCGRSLAA